MLFALTVLKTHRMTDYIYAATATKEKGTSWQDQRSVTVSRFFIVSVDRRVRYLLCFRHPTASAKALCFNAIPLFRSSGQILLPRYLMHALNSFDKTVIENIH